MVRLIDLDNTQEMLELLALQMAAYQIEAEWVGLADVPPLLQSPQSVRDSGEIYYGCFMEDRLAGAVSLKREQPSLLAAPPGPVKLHICRLMVQPGLLRRGIASELLRRVLQLAAAEGLDVTVLAVSINEPAMSLYGRFGFRTIRQHPAIAGLTLNEMVARPGGDQAALADGDKNL
ncbi:GNAT family N-acetyltransferase [Paenibacillus sp. YN15]|uniref:GNAT family N-acetyltransferase n=1 Tax=Paenibacillus sp. YN15 TaxID=1742774 RepID=UPI000DCD0A6B|nr:GNAT family N-acetyltransferase [Paenibacillus sp. YN15]RAU95066.1 GNAT family N-acetyltransferase [Paenibacillus sp. YN15]